MHGLLAVLARPELRLLGIHSHIGSQILDPSGFEVAARAVLTLRARARASAPACSSTRSTSAAATASRTCRGRSPSTRTGSRRTSPRRSQATRARPGHPAAAVLHRARPRDRRPGRPDALHGRHGQAGADRRRHASATYVSVDGGMSDNIRPALYGAQYHARGRRPAVGRRRRCWRASSASTARAATSSCTRCQLPADVRAGDLLAVAATGAYGRSMASNYNHVPRPPVVAVADGASRVLVRRETEDDLLALDLG